MQESKIVGLTSKKLNKAQQNYTVTEQECLAIVHALNEFKILIFNQKVIIHTDHKLLQIHHFYLILHQHCH